MIYQLPNGKVIEISLEQYIELSDEELEYLIAYNYGETLEDPWFGSVLSKSDNDSSDITEIHPDLTDTSENDKLEDLDIDTEYPDQD